MTFVLSNHVLERASERGISLEIIDDILTNPDQILDDESGEEGQKVYQSIVSFTNSEAYLVRVFVNVNKSSPVVKSVYRTTKISKYYEGEI